MNESITKVNIAYPINKHANMYAWKNGTCVIVGDSIILGLNEKQMGDRFKVRGFSGTKIHDMYHYLHPLLEKKNYFHQSYGSVQMTQPIKMLFRL